MEHERPADEHGRLAVATVVTSNVNRAAREHATPDRYDVVLDVLPDDRQHGVPQRVQLVDVTLGQMLPMIGSSVTVRVVEPGAAEPGAVEPRTVEIVWRGDPNLDVDAHRGQIAALAESARRRRERWID